MTHLVLLLVLGAAVQSTACPEMCVCRQRGVACEGYAGNVTEALPEDTVEIVFRGLDEGVLEEVLQELDGGNFTMLERITVTMSIVPETLNLSSGFPSLRSINLPRNKLVDLSCAIIDVATLQTLDLSENTIATIKNGPFRTLRSLEMLNLSANSLTALDSTGFSGLGNLKCLDLSNNNLTGFEDKSFAPLVSLQYLNLSSNHLKFLNGKCFISLLKLQQLDLSKNDLLQIQMDSLRLPNLARLFLADNPRLGLSTLLVGTGQKLQTVDASRIGLKQVPAALTHSIRTLRLFANSIKTVRCGDLDSYPLLQLLDFNSNGLELIEDDALGRLDSLTILYLTNNTMKEIPKSLSEKLKVLHLEYNKINKIGEKDLEGLPSLEVLLLNDNEIHAIEEEAFNQLTSLVTLDISRNPIKMLDSLSGSLTLQVLRLSNIGVAPPAKEVSFPVSSPEHLITLDLSGSPGLARQLLVDTAALAASRELQELDLSHTDLDNIRSDLLHFLPQLRLFRIHGNRINCSRLEWLAAWMRRQDEPEYRDVVCSSPPELWGTLLVDLQQIETPEKDVETTTMRFLEAFAENQSTPKGASQHNDGTAAPTEETSPHQPSTSTMTTSNQPPKSTNKLDRKNIISPFVQLPSSGDPRTSIFKDAEQQMSVLLPVVALVGAVLFLSALAARFAKRKREVRRLREEEEANEVTELW